MNWGTLTRAERDAAYDNPRAVPAAATLIPTWIAESATLRATHPHHLDIAYGPRERNKWDLYPAADPKAPCLVFIHGGYWQRFGRESFANLAAGPLAMGWSVALPGYTLCPEITLSELVSEIHQALDWFAMHAPAHGIAGPAILSGWSAGGHLTALCLDHPAVAGGLAISGIFELGPLRDTYLNERLQLTDAEIADLSPLRLPMSSKPLAIAYGTAELPPLRADSRDLHARRSLHHAPGALIPVAGANHFTVMNELRQPDGLLARHLPLLLPSRLSRRDLADR